MPSYTDVKLERWYTGLEVKALNRTLESKKGPVYYQEDGGSRNLHNLKCH
jgi:hypothetical protein